MAQPTDNKDKDWRASLPFPHHWLYYIVAKAAILALIAGFALHWYGLL
ncbi:hypothetical protein [Rhodoblastus sp.]|jgi:hypothetical protein|nr:hypothetical protein [Rhodoblastus sp.]